MGVEHEEKEIRAMLAAAGAKLKRRGSGNTEIWELPNGMKFSACIGPGGHRERRALKNNLSQLRRALGKVEPEKILQAGIHHGVALTDALQASGAPREAIAQAIEKPALFAAQLDGSKPERWQPPPSNDQPKEREVKVLHMKPKEDEKPESQDVPKKHASWRARWTAEQDKIVIEGYEAKLSPKDIAQLLQDIRPGCTGEEVASRAAALRERYKALGPGYPKAIVQPPAPAPTPLPAPAPAQKAPMPPPVAEMLGLATITFEIGSKKRVVQVDEETARKLLAELLL